MATILSKGDLLHAVAQAVNECGWNISYLNDEHPFRVMISRGTEFFRAKIIIYNCTHGGGRMRAADEYRIQLKINRLDHERGYKTLILGYYEPLNVFAGWDINKHLGPVGYSASFQIQEENLERASLSGLSPCDKGNGEIAIAFRPDLFVEYALNLEDFHAFGRSQKDLRILAEVAETEVVPNTAMINEVAASRRTALITLSKKLRDNSFRARVLRAYNYRCAFSGMQLRLVDAAHILPVSDSRSTDETSNGIALSSIYHKAYDKGLITFSDKYKIIINEAEIARLRGMNLDGGIQKFRSDIRPIIDVPPAVSDRPNVAYVLAANKVRGWKT